MHTAMLTCPHCSASHLQWWGQPISNVAQGYRLGLPTAIYASLPGAAKNKICKFSVPTWSPKFFALKNTLGHPTAILKIWRQSLLPLPNKHADIRTNKSYIYRRELPKIHNWSTPAAQRCGHPGREALVPERLVLYTLGWLFTGLAVHF